MKSLLLIIDPQNDFMAEDDGTPYQGEGRTATLGVKGAVGDMHRVAALLKRLRAKISNVVVSLDSHTALHVWSPVMWRDGNLGDVLPFTVIRKADVESGVYVPRIHIASSRILHYLSKLEAQNSRPMIVWPEHCMIGTWGHNVFAPVMNEIIAWQRFHLQPCKFVLKGTNMWTEHYGVLEAEVPDVIDRDTTFNADLWSCLVSADKIFIAGEAGSHCVKSTLLQIMDHGDEQLINRLYLVRDCISPVVGEGGSPDFTDEMNVFFHDVEAHGVKLINSTELVL
jgi:nicotinamidase/pyrazinamidase